VLARLSEGALPIFSDILYFKSNFDAIPGITRNVASVMLLNLADIAAVNVAPEERQKEAAACVREIGVLRRELANLPAGDERKERLTQAEADKGATLLDICSDPKSCLGLRMRKMHDVMTDFEILVSAIKDPRVNGNRGQLKTRLLEIEQNPSRAISRIRRLLLEAAETSGCERLTEFFGVTEVESVLVGMLGGHQFQFFCEQFAAMVKLDYGLNFFKAVMCASALEHMGLKRNPKVWSKISAEQRARLDDLQHGSAQSLASAIVIRYVKVLRSLVSRYTGVIDTSSSNRRRFGFQLRDLTERDEVREKIVDFLIDQNKEFAALTWIGDEVTVWSMD
jgi:hypothetical protein